MSNPLAQRKPTALQSVGGLVFVVFCGIPAVEMNGLGFDLPFTLSTALICATVGGAIGGMMICPRPVLAGLIGGLIAGPLGFLGVYYYAQHRAGDLWDLLWDLEVVIVQGVASLPGIGVGWWLKRTLAAGADRGPSMRDNEGADIAVSRRRTPRVLLMAGIFLLIACLLAATVFRVYVERFYFAVYAPSLPHAIDESIELADFRFYGDPEATNMVFWSEISHKDVTAFGLSLQGVGRPIGNLDADITGVSIYGNNTLDIPASALTKEVTNVWVKPADGRDWSTATAEEIGDDGVLVGQGEEWNYWLPLPEGERGSVQFRCQLPDGRRITLLPGTVVRLQIAVRDERRTRNHVLDIKVERVDRRVEVKHWLARHLERF